MLMIKCKAYDVVTMQLSDLDGTGWSSHARQPGQLNGGRGEWMGVVDDL